MNCRQVVLTSLAAGAIACGHAASDPNHGTVSASFSGHSAPNANLDTLAPGGIRFVLKAQVYTLTAAGVYEDRGPGGNGRLYDSQTDPANIVFPQLFCSDSSGLDAGTPTIVEFHITSIAVDPSVSASTVSRLHWDAVALQNNPQRINVNCRRGQDISGPGATNILVVADGSGGAVDGSFTISGTPVSNSRKRKKDCNAVTRDIRQFSSARENIKTLQIKRANYVDSANLNQTLVMSAFNAAIHYNFDFSTLADGSYFNSQIAQAVALPLDASGNAIATDLETHDYLFAADSALSTLNDTTEAQVERIHNVLPKEGMISYATDTMSAWLQRNSSYLSASPVSISGTTLSVVESTYAVEEHATIGADRAECTSSTAGNWYGVKLFVGKTAEMAADGTSTGRFMLNTLGETQAGNNQTRLRLAVSDWMDQARLEDSAMSLWETREILINNPDAQKYPEFSDCQTAGGNFAGSKVAFTPDLQAQLFVLAFDSHSNTFSWSERATNPEVLAGCFGAPAYERYNMRTDEAVAVMKVMQ